VDQFGGSRSELQQSASLFVALPADGRYGEKVYNGSGRATAEALAAELRKRFALVQTAASFTTSAVAIQGARAAACSHVIYPTILNWEDRATEWSGKLDRIEIQLEVLEVPSGRALYSAVVKANGAWATFGGDHPQDLLREPLGAFADRLAARK
jgi:hypothetical protein